MPRHQKSNAAPRIVHLGMLDTDYAQMAAGEAIPEDKKQRLAAESYDFDKLGKQIARLRYAPLDQEDRDDILFSIGSTAELFTMADLEDIHDRVRQCDRLYLTSSERQQVINWVHDELGVDLSAPI